MSGLAAILHLGGARVTGSDCASSTAIDQLRAKGVKITEQTGAALPTEIGLVVASAAIPSEHPELAEARRRGYPVIKYAEMLGAVMAQRTGFAVSGTHGKSTTTAWLAYALRVAGLNPSFVVGADVAQLGGGSGAGAGPDFVVEACEYDRSFLQLAPRHAVILNIEEDHLDCYENLAAITDAFAAFADRVPPDGLLLVNGDDPCCREIADGRPNAVTFGFGHDCDWRAAELTLADGRRRFELIVDRHSIGAFEVGLSGRHNVMNALAVAALARKAGATWDAIRAALRDFVGARRRLEQIADIGGVIVADDYAHHPTEIAATLSAARERWRPNNLWCVFQPHQHSRTRFLLADFASSFSEADHVIAPDIYFVRDSRREQELVSANDLVDQLTQKGVDATYQPDFDAIVERLADRLRPGDLVLTMGAGNIWKVADALAARLRAHL